MAESGLPFTARRTAASFRPYFMSVVVGVLCLVISLLLFLILNNQENDRQNRAFDQEANVYAASLQRQIDLDLEIIHSIVSLFAASSNVSRQEFKEFSLQIMRSHNELQALEWVPRVHLWERERYETNGRNQGFADFQFRELAEDGSLKRAGQRAEYFPVYYLEPLAGNERALGFDLGSEENRREALNRARDKGQPFASDPITLIQESGAQVGVLVFFPIYKRARTGDSIAARREDLRGFALGVIRMGDMIDLILPEDTVQPMDFRLVDISAPGDPVVLVEFGSTGFSEESSPHQAAEPERWAAPKRTFRINIPERKWRLEFREPSINFSHRFLRASWGALLFGALLSLLVAAYLANRIRHSLGIEALEVDLNRTSLKLKRGLEERQKATEALYRSEARFGAVFENGQFAMTVCDVTGNILQCNQAFERLLGYPADEIRRVHFHTITYADDQASSLDLFQQLVAGKISHFDIEKRYVKKDGTLAWCRTAVSALSNDTGAVEGTIAMLVDVTTRIEAERERNDLQQQLTQTQKMEAIGRLAGGIAHDFNNMLTVMRGYTSLSLEEVEGGDPVFGHLEEIEKAVDRAESLTRQLLAFSRKQMLQLRVLNINEIIVNMTKMLGRLIGEDVELCTDLGDDVHLVEVDVGQIEQVIMNLAVNARDAMPDGGELAISTRNVILPRPGGGADPEIPDGQYVMLIMRDTGQGMDRDTMDKIFEPFFTTKEVGAGTGLGLATVYGVMTQSGGHVRVASTRGEGSTFTIYLPGTSKPVEGSTESLGPRQSREGSETILLVEDESMVRKVAHETLASFGYHVLDATNGADALRVCEYHDGNIDLILTDVIMPLMNGRDLVDRIRPRYPQAKVLYMSGYTGDRTGRSGLLERNAPFLAKPFRPRALVAKVREVLDGGGS